MKEEWRPVRNYEGLYEVSNMGRVKSLERMKWNGNGYYKAPERILKPRRDKDGYLYVHLHKDGKEKFCKIHRLVAVAFVENHSGFNEINHIDENKENNCADNLEWCSRSYNLSYNDRAKRVGKKSAEKLRGRKLSEETIKKIAEKKSKPVYSINKVSGLITYWNSAKEAGKVLDIDQGSITRCCQGKLKSCGGFYWMYKNNNDAE